MATGSYHGGSTIIRVGRGGDLSGYGRKVRPKSLEPAVAARMEAHRKAAGRAAEITSGSKRKKSATPRVYIWHAPADGRTK